MIQFVIRSRAKIRLRLPVLYSRLRLPVFPAVRNPTPTQKPPTPYDSDSVSGSATLVTRVDYYKGYVVLIT